mmetsp:Transcript_85811/g.265706  ORF Transcript_85811/g.265706 Transcript_85811/m.265706 type:complete len:281 (+) Transcript_85811:247-1089(+)
MGAQKSGKPQPGETRISGSCQKRHVLPPRFVSVTPVRSLYLKRVPSGRRATASMTRRDSRMSTVSNSKDVAVESSPETSRGSATMPAMLYSMMSRKAMVRRNLHTLDPARSSAESSALNDARARRPRRFCWLSSRRSAGGSPGRKSITNRTGSRREGCRSAITGVNMNSNGLKPRSKAPHSRTPRCNRNPLRTRPERMRNELSRPKARLLLEFARTRTCKALASAANKSRNKSETPASTPAQSRGRPVESRKNPPAPVPAPTAIRAQRLPLDLDNACPGG